jgi:hypothetical protein
MSAKYPLLSSIAVDLVSLIPGEGTSNDKLNIAHQLLHAALGTVSPEVASQGGLPVIKLSTAFDAEHLQYNLYQAMERARKNFKMDQWQAMLIGEQVVKALRNARIGVGQVQVLLDPKFKKAAKNKAFSALRNNLVLNDSTALDPKTATLAIATEKVPMPDLKWETRLSLAANNPFRHLGDIVEIAASTECYLWEFPPSDFTETAWATHDRCFPSKQYYSAEMGLGFTFITAPWKREDHFFSRGLINQHQLYTPMIDCRREVAEPDLSKVRWRLGNLHRGAIRNGGHGHPKLTDLLPGGLSSLLRIHACKKCNTLYAEDSPKNPGIPTTCKCNSPKSKTPHG